MPDTFSKTIDCVLCQSTFDTIYEPQEGQDGYPIYCSSCTKWVYITRGDSVRVTLREVLGLKGEALALAIQTYLRPCPCSNEFSHDAGKRCPACIKKINRELAGDTTSSNPMTCIWNIEKMKNQLEGKAFEYILNRMDSEEETLAQLIDRFESGQLDPGTYMEMVDDLQFRESRDISVVKCWAMLAGPEMAFRAADEHAFTERYGTRILISIASGIETGHGISVLTSLSNEEKNLDGPVRKELQMFIKKIAGGF